ncbi:MAG: GNAT family N-acetyltransferase [Acidobacteriia bacterium]|nr:GNAT family N-acetyltransferase [Terriglobia bacterium]
MSEVAIREAAESDLAEILRLYEEAGIDGGRPFTLEEARAHFARFRRYPDYRVFVALVEGAITGTYALLTMDNLAKRGARTGVVEDVAVSPVHQRQGVGRAMMHHARAQCQAAGCYKLMLSSGLPRTAAHRFYDSLGFERHGYSFVIRP